MKFLLRFILFFSIILFSLSSVAWNAVGHMVVANIAYQQLTPVTLSKVDNLITYLQKEYPNTSSFLLMADWADDLRSQKIETFTHWHYIDKAFSLDGTPLKNIIDTDNAVWAINNIIPIIKNDKTNPYERARFLAFLIHIVGDLHQPLHTVSLFSAAHPDGDKGGNLYIIQLEKNGMDAMNLHKLWDNGLGVFNVDPDQAVIIANAITTQYPPSYFGAQINDLNPDDWTQEGLNHAKQYVYTTPENQIPSANYVETGKQMAQQNAALAGYRLGNLLNQLLQ